MSKNKLEHIAFILDGNKRWAKKKKISLKESYKHGFQNIGNLINNCLKIKIPHLTLFTLSSENIHRKSVSNIFQVIYDDLHPPERRMPEHQYPDRYVKRLINIPTRGHPDNYHLQGVLTRKQDERPTRKFNK